MTHILPEAVEILAGVRELESRPIAAYSTEACSFLDRLSQELRQIPEIQEYPDIATFSFWCRSGHIKSLKSRFEDGRSRIGRGLSFHVAPSNVPINFAFSLAMGLLAGNPTVVRVPSNKFRQAELIATAINRIFSQKQDSALENMLALIRYDREDAINRQLSLEASSRVIWGGDATIESFNKYPTSPRCVDVLFGDRTSLSVLSAREVNALNENNLQRLVDNFYNDTFLMGQKACSSPHLVVWLGGESETGRERFWQILNNVAVNRYQIDFVDSVEKLTKMCQDAVILKEAASFSGYSTSVYRVTLKSLPANSDELRGTCGYFFEYETEHLRDLADIVTDRYQTMTYFGVTKEALCEFVCGNRLRGIDRIVPIGAALDLDVVWDGYDVIGALSRIIDLK